MLSERASPPSNNQITEGYLSDGTHCFFPEYAAFSLLHVWESSLDYDFWVWFNTTHRYKKLKSGGFSKVYLPWEWQLIKGDKDECPAT